MKTLLPLFSFCFEMFGITPKYLNQKPNLISLTKKCSNFLMNFSKLDRIANWLVPCFRGTFIPIVHVFVCFAIILNVGGIFANQNTYGIFKHLSFFFWNWFFRFT